ncbi:hypothetical protein [Rhizobium sp. LCM 4573]|uniref:hypothetical protein n=1 Tax=Rhizobium sp. LCM 4573 TaxID=1848291 RepID=UPI0008D91291|nr:hypothetical protein [Rhizobium sp. LCM 4573]OHV81589.1 hypothetical protein LCM4573_21125 [Rhizobium sp. LCM 4573]
MPKTEGPDPRYKWRLTDPEAPDHFAGFDGEWRVGSIQKHHMGFWQWFADLSEYPHGPALCAASGIADTPRLAAKAAEDCYDAQLAGTWPGMSEQMIMTARELAVREGRQRKDA